MPHNLATVVRKIMHASIRNPKYSNIDVQQKHLPKRGKSGHHLRFPSFSFLEEKPLDFICAA